MDYEKNMYGTNNKWNKSQVLPPTGEEWILPKCVNIQNKTRPLQHVRYGEVGFNTGKESKHNFNQQTYCQYQTSIYSNPTIEVNKSMSKKPTLQSNPSGVIMCNGTDDLPYGIQTFSNQPEHLKSRGANMSPNSSYWRNKDMKQTSNGLFSKTDLDQCTSVPRQNCSVVQAQKAKYSDHEKTFISPCHKDDLFKVDPLKNVPYSMSVNNVLPSYTNDFIVLPSKRTIQPGSMSANPGYLEIGNGNKLLESSNEVDSLSFTGYNSSHSQKLHKFVSMESYDNVNKPTECYSLPQTQTANNYCNNDVPTKALKTMSHSISQTMFSDAQSCERNSINTIDGNAAYKNAKFQNNSCLQNEVENITSSRTLTISLDNKPRDPAENLDLLKAQQGEQFQNHQKNFETRLLNMDHSNQVQTFEKNHAKKLLKSYLDETEITEKELDNNSTDKHDKSSQMQLVYDLSRYFLAVNKNQNLKNDADGEMMIEDELDRTDLLGGDQLVSVVGHFCRLCCKFYADEYTAKVVHCGSTEHHDKYEEWLDTDRKSNSKDNNAIEKTVGESETNTNTAENEEKTQTIELGEPTSDSRTITISNMPETKQINKTRSKFENVGILYDLQTGNFLPGIPKFTKIANKTAVDNEVSLREKDANQSKFASANYCEEMGRSSNRRQLRNKKRAIAQSDSEEYLPNKYSRTDIHETRLKNRREFPAASASSIEDEIRSNGLLDDEIISSSGQINFNATEPAETELPSKQTIAEYENISLITFHDADSTNDAAMGNQEISELHDEHDSVSCNAVGSQATYVEIKVNESNDTVICTTSTVETKELDNKEETDELTDEQQILNSESNTCDRIEQNCTESNTCDKMEQIFPESNICDKMEQISSELNACDRIEQISSESNTCDRIEQNYTESNTCDKTEQISSETNTCGRLEKNDSDLFTSDRIEQIYSESNACDRVDQKYSELNTCDEIRQNCSESNTCNRMELESIACDKIEQISHPESKNFDKFKKSDESDKIGELRVLSTVASIDGKIENIVGKNLQNKDSITNSKKTDKTRDICDDRKGSKLKQGQISGDLIQFPEVVKDKCIIS